MNDDNAMQQGESQNVMH